MVAYGMPVIHQSLATAPLDIKEAIDWLIRIGGKDVKGEGKDRTAELIKVVKCCIQQECNVTGAENAINEAYSSVTSLPEQLSIFIGYKTNGDAFYGPQEFNGSGIGRRGGHTILSEIFTGRFLMCCKNDAACTSDCKCCNNGNVGDSRCNPNSCPIKKVLECSISLIGICGDDGNRNPNGKSNSTKICCILTFLIACFQEDEEFCNSSFQCQHCDGSQLHKSCHKDCTCVHKKVISKVACRINCLIQLATTITTLWINKNVFICRTCQNCNICNPKSTEAKCNPCSECNSALTGKGEHCDLCRTGQCCEENKEKNSNCKSNCENCPNCSLVRNVKAFWDMLYHASYSCGKCTECSSTTSPRERKDCETCSVCPGDSCNDGCKYRKLFGRLIYEFLHFMVYNFGDVAYALKEGISRIKDDCCKQRGRETECQCSEACCGSSTGKSVCRDCQLYCMCCVDEKNKGSCNCANQCAEKLELLLRPALSGYVSAYDYNTATWENLCKELNNKGKCSDECTAACQCASAGCPAEGCCAHCPKRKCAKILCMVVPAIYRFIDYTNQKIDGELKNSDGTTTSQWASALITGDAYLADLLRKCGFPSDRLQSKIGCELMKKNHDATSELCQSRDHKPGNIKELLKSCDALNKNIAEALRLCSIKSVVELPYRKPDTVRDKLLWLGGLPYSDVYGDLQQTLKDSMPHVSSNVLTIELILRMALFTFHILEDSSQSFWQFVTQGFNVPNTKYSLHYNRDPVRLLWDVYDVLYDVTCALTFMNKQCNVSSINSGWEDCKFGRDVNINGSNSDICQCQTGTCTSTCDHCSKVCKACRPGAKCVCCCPHCEQRPDRCICLMRFITSNGSMTNASHASPFCSERYGQMGFSQGSLRKIEMRGAEWYDCMSGILTDDHALFSRLLEYLLIARAGVPENLSDYYGLLLRLGTKLELESHVNSEHKKQLANAFKDDMANVFYGAHDSLIEPIVSALQNLYNQDSRKPHGASMIHKGTTTHNASDLASLYGCYNGTACVGYMYALSSGPYELFSRYPYNGTEEFASICTNWVICGASTLYVSMRRLAEEVSALECCKEHATCTCNSIISNTCDCKDCNCFCQSLSTICSCGTIIKCKYVHPLLYKNGFTFHEPDMWSYPNRRCKDFSDTLHRFIGPDSMLCQLIEAIEQFLWHVRMPFCIALLTLWATAFCFLIYVFIGHMDRLGIRSLWFIPKHIVHPMQLVTRTLMKPMGGGGVMFR